MRITLLLLVLQLLPDCAHASTCLPSSLQTPHQSTSRAQSAACTQPLAPTFKPSERNKQGRAIEWVRIIDEDNPEESIEVEQEIDEEEPTDDIKELSI